jgi:hypothetical protein
MKFLMIHRIYESELIGAIEALYEAWKIEDERQRHEERQRGWIRCYSNLHTMFEDPIKEIQNAERVSFTDGVIGPPGDDYFFLLGENYLKDLSNMLERGGFDVLATILRTAKLLPVPESHCFIDSENNEYEITGWGKEDAQRRIESQSWLHGPFEWSGSHLAFPSMGVVWRGKRTEEYGEEIELEMDQPEALLMPVDDSEIPF